MEFWVQSPVEYAALFLAREELSSEASLAGVWLEAKTQPRRFNPF
jgi:hypothetical protein